MTYFVLLVAYLMVGDLLISSFMEDKVKAKTIEIAHSLKNMWQIPFMCAAIVCSYFAWPAVMIYIYLSDRRN